MRIAKLTGVAALTVVDELDVPSIVAHQGNGGGVVDELFGKQAGPAITKQSNLRRLAVVGPFEGDPAYRPLNGDVSLLHILVAGGGVDAMAADVRL